MSYCPNCGANNPDTSAFCSSCGTPLKANTPPQGYAASPVYTVPIQPRYVAAIPTGGLLAWSIVTLLLCTIPGIVAIVKTSSINKSFTVEEQQQKLSSAKTWCIVGTILGVLLAIGMFSVR